MKKLSSLALIAVVLLVGCDKTDERKEVADQLKQVYEHAGVKAKSKSVGDAAAGKIVAENKCAGCHGMDGVLANRGAPFIAGLDQDYMVSAMLGYTDGSRKNDPMQALITELKIKPEQIANVSAYYASLKSTWKGAHVGETADRPIVPMDKASIAAGAKLARRCNHCHGPSEAAIQGEPAPKLAGMPPEYFVPSLQSYFNGRRSDDVMSIFRTSLNERQIKQLAAYYAMQPPGGSSRAGRGNVKAGEEAAGQCAGCHSIDGNALNPEIPSLAGQPAEYLIKATQDYRDGQRKDPFMSDAARHLRDHTIADLAAYYARQKPEPALLRVQQSAQGFDPVAEGRRMAGSCDGCHGKNGNSEKPGIPSLAGLHVKYLVIATRDYRDGTRKNERMQKLVNHLNDTDIEKVGFYYATQSPVARKAVPKADLAAGEKIAANCTSCHGTGGVSTTPETPSLAGQDAAYLAAATKAYANGTRSHEAMTEPAKALKPDEIANVTAYFASLPASKPEINLPETPQHSIVEKCNRCHGERGQSKEAGIPRLAGQSEAYLVLAIKEYQDGRRKNKPMNAMSDVLSLVEIKAIAAYYARQ